MHRCFCRILAVLLCLMIFSSSSLFAQPEESVLPALQEDSLYRLNRYDVLNIVILGFSTQENDLGLNDVMIGPDGFVNLPYAGSVRLSGLTVDEATVLLRQRLGEYIKIPGMTVMVKTYGPRKVYVVGEVKNPGIYDLSWDRMSVISAISSAGGISLKGRTKEIHVVRMVDGKAVSQKVNYKNLTRKGDLSQNMALQDGDLVYVPHSGKIDFNTDIMPFVNVFLLYKAATD
ncbi:MAG: polysaccharide biosynthesis/export family protein [Sporomusaceae bacterium]|nr:polysaccharide biosynthesis/export family protein [Sporomusaceae bacterium]